MHITHRTPSLRRMWDAPALTPTRPAPPVPTRGQHSPQAAGDTSQLEEASFFRAQTTMPQHEHAYQRSPGAGGSAQTIVRRGWANVKDEGLRSWIWNKRWLVLKETCLLAFKNDVRTLSLRFGLQAVC